ncbi:amidohydrolase family protein [Treponema zioleckii]|uniref:amidohydrolase family protein n=1 Tax=Treponema zioleckii TaxID=331680 RepID=UPI003BF473A8
MAEYPNAKVILAHSNPVKETAEMVNKYPNVFCDTACLSKENLTKLRQKVTDKSKILFGSDFPVSHYFASRFSGKTSSLEDEYILTAKNYMF